MDNIATLPQKKAPAEDVLLDDKQVITCCGYDFAITERTNDKQQIIRIYEKQPEESILLKDLHTAKELLVALGMDIESVDDMPTSTIRTIANSSRIIVTSGYSRADEERNVYYISKETALKEVSQKSAKQSDKKTKPKGPFQDGSSIGGDGPGTYQDEYMHMTYVVAQKKNGECLFVVNANWLTMPFFRGNDSIGACTMNSTVRRRSCSGFYKYSVTTSANGKISHYNKRQDINSIKTDMKNGNWHGSAGIIKLPGDVCGELITSVVDNLRVHYEYSGHVNYPGVESWHNSVATYDHSTIAISFDPSVSIDLNGASASIGLKLTGKTEKRNVEMEIHYLP